MSSAKDLHEEPPETKYIYIHFYVVILIKMQLAPSFSAKSYPFHLYFCNTQVWYVARQEIALCVPSHKLSPRKPLHILLNLFFEHKFVSQSPFQSPNNATGGMCEYFGREKESHFRWYSHVMAIDIWGYTFVISPNRVQSTCWLSSCVRKVKWTLMRLLIFPSIFA